MEILKKVFKQTAWQLIGKVASSISTLIILGLVSRYYGKAGIGEFSLALTYLSFFYLASDLGLNSYLLPRLKTDLSEVNKLINFRFSFSLFLVVVANLGVFLMPFKNSNFNLAVFLGSLTIIASSLITSANLIFQKYLSYENATIASSVGSLAVIPLMVLLVFFNLPIGFLILAPLFGLTINCLIALSLVKKFFTLDMEDPDLKYSFNLLKSAWPISLTLILNTLYFRVDSFILSSSKSFTEVGIYNLAYSFFQTALVLPTFIMNGYFPLLLNFLEKGKSSFFIQIKNAGLLLFLISILGIVLTFGLGPILINLISGNNFSESAHALNLLSLGFPAYFLSSLLMWTLLALKKYYHLALIYFIGLVANLALNLIFIPKYSYIAASLNTGISEYLILLLLALTLYKIIKS
ncbi:flippase [Candidatus Daviesbacteria bacterium]|nr:flippase [Candidatus Daviesbacteria bacterium]